MKKVVLLLILLLAVTIPSAQAFFMIASPTDTDSGGNVKVPVYNNSGSALDEGDVVVWDIGSSTGDNDLYVTTTTTADTGLVAGVVTSGGIAAGSSGAIIVYGLAQCDVTSLGVPAGTILCSSATAGAGTACSSAANEAYAYAITSAVIGANSQGNCFVGGK